VLELNAINSSFDFFYGTNTLNDHISRPRALKINGGKIVTYDYLGLNTPVIVDYKAEPSVYLDYTVAPTGGSTESETYKSFDRFGRTVLQNWIHEVTTSNLVDVVKIEHTYDRNSNRTSRDDQIDFIDNDDTVVTRDELYTYDGLNRLTNNQRGKLTSGSIAAGDRVQTEDWTLDALGNWDQYNYDGNGDEDFLDSTDLNDNRSHNDANELTDWDPYAADSGNQPVSPTLDGNGNLTDDKFAYKYTYDAWNRLVKVENQASTPVGYYGYDGLGCRIKHIFDTDGDGVAETNGDDIVYHEYYTANWERIEVRPDDLTTGASVFLYGLRNMDDIVLRLRDANQNGGLEERTYYLHDANGNVVMTIDDAAHGVERVFYRAYGEPECFPFGDLNGDYTTNASDLTIFDNIKTGGTYEKYNLLADVNLDGVVDATDRSYLLSNRNGWTGGADVQSVDEVVNDIGYAGYLFNDESQNYHVRNREYSPKLGRWLQRDPLEYPDGMNLYQYVSGTPQRFRDPFGLDPAQYMYPMEFDPYYEGFHTPDYLPYGPGGPYRPHRPGGAGGGDNSGSNRPDNTPPLYEKPFLYGPLDACVEYASRLNPSSIPIGVIPNTPLGTGVIPNPFYKPVDDFFRDGQHDPDDPNLDKSRICFAISDTAGLAAGILSAIKAAMAAELAAEEGELFIFEGRNNPIKGEPGSRSRTLQPNGLEKQDRYHGPDGLPIKDIDYHDGHPDIHIHDWRKIPNQKYPVRQPGRLTRPGELPADAPHKGGG